MSNVDSTLRDIAVYQIPLPRESLKYCGVVTPFRGIRVYQRCAMGMPGSETALEELMSRILGDHLISGNVTKIANDLYCGADDLELQLNTWRSVLTALDRCDLKLSPSKTVICPSSTIILGWNWSEGKLSATNVKGLRSFIGAYKVLSRVITGYSDILSPIERCVTGEVSTEKLIWTDEFNSSFTQTKNKLRNTSSVVLPKPSDQLWIVTDGALKDPGIGARLEEVKNPCLLDFSVPNWIKHQPFRVPCEIEALSIATAVKHFFLPTWHSRNTKHLS